MQLIVIENREKELLMGKKHNEQVQPVQLDKL